MKLKSIFYSVVLFLIFSISQNAIASGSSSEKTMAKILSHLNHYPSSSEKIELSTIINNSESIHEKAVATAIINLQHSASSAAKKELKKVMDDGHSSTQLKDIAGIVFRLNHQPSRSDKKLLTAIID